MPGHDLRVEAYIENASDFARPILQHFRELVHEAAPQIEETIKWGVPHFEHKGIVCNMAAFKQHCAIGFWKGDLIVPEERSAAGEAWGQLGRITSLDDLPPDEILISYVREGVRLNVESISVPRKKTSLEDVAVPPALAAALDADPRARSAFDALSPSHQREYAEWIAEAKREQTRERRIATALEWIAEGKPRNWKYLKRTS
jgi:uncharacterized protein YdeI (YjbR/CyaY-like superfamily)